MPDWKFLYLKYSPNRLVSRFWASFSATLSFDGLVFHYPPGFPPQDAEYLSKNGQETYDVLLKSRGDTAVDIGSGVGSYALRLARQFRSVLAFEPNSFIAKYLRKNIERNRKTNVTPVEAAISDKTGTEMLRLPSRYSSASTLSSHHYSKLVFKDKMSVKTFALDDYFLGYKGKIDLVKLDAENHELAVLNGARETIREHQPLLSVEVHRRPDSLLACDCQVCKWLKKEYPGYVELHGTYASEMEVHWTVCYPS